MNVILERSSALAVLDETACNGCALCPSGCRYGALIWVRSERTPLVDPWSCTGCGSCISPCPSDALHLEKRAR